MTPERLAEIRDRASYGISHHSLADRRDLLDEVDRLTAEVDRFMLAAKDVDKQRQRLSAEVQWWRDRNCLCGADA